MSSLLHPVGPEPASVYWRRRIIVIVAVLAVIGVLWALLSRGGSDQPSADSAGPTPLPTLTTESPSASPSATATGAPCLDSDIEVTVAADQQSFPLGGPVEFVMKIANNGPTACVRDVGPQANTFTVTSGGFDVWDSDSCSEPGDSQEEEIPAGEAFAVKGTWDATVTANGCNNATQAQAGAYQVVASNGEASSDPLVLGLG